MNFRMITARSLMTLALVVAPAAITGCAVDGTEYGQTEDEATAKAQKAGRFELFEGQDGQKYFHLLAANGEKVLASEGYSSWSAAASGIASVQKNGVDANAFDLREAKNGQYYFNLLAANGEVIGTSELYASKSNATRAIGTVSAIIAKTVEMGNAPTGAPLFRSFKGLDGKYRFNLRAKNGQIVLQSQGYTTKASADNGVASVQQNGQSASNYQILEAVNGEFYFVLRAANKQIIGVSETYVSRSGAESAVTSVVNLIKGGEAQLAQ
jgi:uncharacterized protein YegP (UPF0339 family)